MSGEQGMYAAVGQRFCHGIVVSDDIVFEVLRLAIDVLKHVVMHHRNNVLAL